MNSIDYAILAKIDELQCRYVAALDSKNMAEWLATFSTRPDASYTCTTMESAAADLPVALILDDNYARLQDRVTFVTEIWQGTYPEYNTRHLTQRTSCKQQEEGLFEVITNFMLAITPSETGRVELTTSGFYADRVIVDGDDASFLAKKVVTDTAVVERFVAYPL